MTSGPPVQLPPSAVAALTHTYTSRSSDCDRFDVYFLSSSSLSVTSLASLCNSITASYVHDILGDEKVEDYHEFLTPVLTPFACVQDCIEHHFGNLDKWLLEQSATEEDVASYPYGIVVFEQTDKEALLIHTDCINKTWHIGSIHLPVTDLGLDLTSLIFGDEYFGDMCNGRNVQVPQNDPNINEAYKDHQKDETGAWKNNAPRFAVFSTGWQYAMPVEGMLDDLHEDAPFGHRDVELYGLTVGRYLGTKDRLRAQFLAYVAADQRGERRHEGKGPCPSCRPLHKSIFIEVDNSDPRVEGVLVCKMEFDGDTDDKSDEQLAEIGRKAKIETRRVGVAFAVATAKVIASDGLNRKAEA